MTSKGYVNAQSCHSDRKGGIRSGTPKQKLYGHFLPLNRSQGVSVCLLKSAFVPTPFDRASRQVAVAKIALGMTSEGYGKGGENPLDIFLSSVYI